MTLGSTVTPVIIHAIGNNGTPGGLGCSRYRRSNLEVVTVNNFDLSEKLALRKLYADCFRHGSGVCSALVRVNQ